jgi:hypothetical protein
MDSTVKLEQADGVTPSEFGKRKVGNINYASSKI